MEICKRCEKPFTPRPIHLGGTKRMTRMCEDCQFRNLMDGLGLPTPPCLLDRHTKVPTLSEREYNQTISDAAERDGGKEGK
jgi:hypothetical protein